MACMHSSQCNYKFVSCMQTTLKQLGTSMIAFVYVNYIKLYIGDAGAYLQKSNTVGCEPCKPVRVRGDYTI